MYTAKVAKHKVKRVQELVELINQYPLVGIVNMENIPAPQLLKMRGQLREKVTITMAKKTLVALALKEAEKSKKEVSKLSEHMRGMPALILTKDNPFKLSSTLRKSRTAAPAKAGQTSPRDITIPAGPTPFAPGPIISELSGVGLKTGVEGGKVAIKEDTTVVKAGEKIKPKVAEILLRLGVQPMEVGLDLVAVYENGLIYKRDVLSIDESEYKNRLANASRWAFNLAVYSAYPTKGTIKTLLGKAFNDAKSLGVSQKIFDAGIIDILLRNAEQQMLSLKTAANIPVIETTHGHREEIKKEQKSESAEIIPLTREELEANIKMREKQMEVKEVEKIYHDIHKKSIEEHEKK